MSSTPNMALMSTLSDAITLWDRSGTLTTEQTVSLCIFIAQELERLDWMMFPPARESNHA